MLRRLTPLACELRRNAFNHFGWGLKSRSMRHRPWAMLVVALLIIIGNSGCKSHVSQEMLVARIGGDIYLPRLCSVDWRREESVDCELASEQFGRSWFIQSPAPDDLLLCGQRTLTAWSVTWLRPDIKTEIYRVADRQGVEFHDAGHSRGWRGSHRYWNCRWSSEHIDCD
jgi:hypothetical protein